MNFNISGFLITVPILIFIDLLMSILYSLSTILCILKKKKGKKIEGNIFIYTHCLQAQNFLINQLLHIC